MNKLIFLSIGALPLSGCGVAKSYADVAEMIVCGWHMQC
jgi:hypothetical protein